jgi:hypothetical protein
MYIPELANYTSLGVEKRLNIIAVGWLDLEYPYSTGNVSSEFRNRLEAFCSNPLIRNFGIDMCPICKKLEPVRIKLGSGKEFSLYGTYEIRIPSKDGKKVYATSDFIIHYVTVHHYQPPQEFIDAVLAAPLPGTAEYDEFTKPWEKYH